MSFRENKKFWSEFIILYKKQGPIWDVNHKDYNNKLIRKQCYEALVQKAKEILSYADENYVKNKLESLRASFRREHKKVTVWKKRGRVYEPLLWYYDLLSFVTKGLQRKSDNRLSRRMKMKTEETYIEDKVIEENADDLTTETLHINVVENSSPNTSESIHLSENPSGSLQFEEVICSASQEAPKRMNVKRSRKRCKQSYLSISDENDDSENISEKEDRKELFARNLMLQLDEMDPLQRIIAEKLISDVIFHGRLKNLTKSSTILLKSVYKIHSDSS